MIQALTLQNLKCFNTLRIELRPLTIFCGFNSGGKSTSLQTLLLLSQTLQGHHRSASLQLNGPLASLGSPTDILGRGGATVPLSLGFTDQNGVDLRWEFILSDDRRFLVANKFIIGNEASGRTIPATQLAGLRMAEGEPAIDAALRRLERLVYLSAGRATENDISPLPQADDLEVGNVGPTGQYASWWLHHQEDTPISKERICGGFEGPTTLRSQLNAWSSHLFTQAELNAVPIQKTNFMRLELKTGLTSDWSRPANNGFGISYAFPILLGGLISPAGQTLIVDSPEAHLHPRGQSRMGSFISRMAAGGVQMLVETHSDHLLNGVRLSLREGAIAAEDVAIYFFTGRPESPVISLSAADNGNISDWPEGFFDQSEKDLAVLAGW